MKDSLIITTHFTAEGSQKEIYTSAYHIPYALSPIQPLNNISQCILEYGILIPYSTTQDSILHFNLLMQYTRVKTFITFMK